MVAVFGEALQCPSFVDSLVDFPSSNGYYSPYGGYGNYAANGYYGNGYGNYGYGSGYYGGGGGYYASPIQTTYGYTQFSGPGYTIHNYSYGKKK